MQNLHVSLVQTDLHWQQPEANMQMLDRLLEPLAGTTDLIVLPEMFLTGFCMQPAEAAEPEHGPGFEWMKRKAQALGAALTGSIAVRCGDRFYNRLWFVAPDGEAEFYDKRHLFRMSGEDRQYSAGQTRKVIHYRGWRILPQICYDLRFPVFSRNRNDYDLVLYVANWPEPRRQVFRVLLQARAIENYCYLAAVNRIGKDGNGYAYAGDSMLVDYRGDPIIDRAPGCEFIAGSSLDGAGLLAFREKFPVWMDADDFVLNKGD